MPPKRRKGNDNSYQSKLPFLPISATKNVQPLNKVTQEILEPRMNFHNDISKFDSKCSNNNGLVSKAVTTSSAASLVSTSSLCKENTTSSMNAFQSDGINGSSKIAHLKTHKDEIGGNSLPDGKIIDGMDSQTSLATSTSGVFSTRDLVSTIPNPLDTTSNSITQSLTDRNRHHSNKSQDMGHSLKRKPETELSMEYVTSPVLLDSDSENDNINPSVQNSSLSTKASESTRQSNTGKKLSLLEQMATPRGTQPVPRSVAPLYGYDAAVKKATKSEGISVDRPILISRGSTVSDDGFNSNSSLDIRMGGFKSNYGSDMSPPRSQSSNQSHQAKPSPPPPYSQRRPGGDFASLSKGGAAGGRGPGLVKSRTLPLTLAGPSGYKPMTPVAPAFSKSSSFAKSQEWERSRSRSSSPVPASTVRTSTSTYDISGDKTKDGMLLSEEQRHVLEQVILYHRNVFFTGSAGTGKSILLRELIHRLRNKYSNAKSTWESGNDPVAVTASTGIAACNIGGCTLHSFAGVGLGTEALPVLIGKVRKNSNAIRRWHDTKVLIIDEVSMVDSDYMDKIEAVARAVRKNEQPWGGIQVVLTGDFFQLPPVTKGGVPKFCFEGYSWSSAITNTIQLQQVFRQKDQTFADMLNEMRLGQMSPATIAKFSNLARPLPSNDNLRPTELFPLRNQVDEANNRMLESLPGNIVTYRAKDSGPLKEKMEQNTLAPTILQLKVNAQVMLLKNQGGGSGGLVNGSIGVLIGFVNRAADNDSLVGSDGRSKGSFNSPGEELPLVRFTLDNGSTRDMVVGREEWKIELPNGDIQGSRIQIPLGLAWSLSIHKSQGQTLSKVRVDLGKVFEKGQAYVAMSRATSLDGLQVLNFDAKKVMVHPKVIEFYRSLDVYKKK